MNICLDVAMFENSVVVVYVVQAEGILERDTIGIERAILARSEITVGECDGLGIDLGEDFEDEDDGFTFGFTLRRSIDANTIECSPYKLYLGDYAEGLTSLPYIAGNASLFVELLRRAVEKANGEKTKVCPNYETSNCCPFFGGTRLVRIGNVKG